MKKEMRPLPCKYEQVKAKENAPESLFFSSKIIVTKEDEKDKGYKM